jgi:1,4-alpha-glucan branching enzyme
VHGKGSLFNKMPGDDWQRAANLRLLLGHMWTHPGKKLLFMGGEFGQRLEWNHDAALQWPLLDQPLHSGLQSWVADLNALYRSRPALHAVDFGPEGFQWVDLHNAELSVIAFLRKARDAEPLLVVANFTPVPREGYLVGVPRAGRWRECLNSDAPAYGGSGIGNLGGVASVPVAAHGHYQALNLRLPPLALLVLEPEPVA